MTKKKWTDMDKIEKVSALIRLAAKGLTAAEIAARYSGCTRNAVIGLAHRNGVTFSSSKGPGRTFDPANGNAKEAIAKIRKAAKDKAAAKVTRIKRVAKKASPAPTECKIINFARPPSKHAGPVHLLDLDTTTCRMPMFEDAKQVPASEYMFCGKSLHGNSPYCLECSKKAFSVRRSQATGTGGDSPPHGRKRRPFLRWQR